MPLLHCTAIVTLKRSYLSYLIYCGSPVAKIVHLFLRLWHISHRLKAVYGISRCFSKSCTVYASHHDPLWVPSPGSAAVVMLLNLTQPSQGQSGGRLRSKIKLTRGEVRGQLCVFISLPDNQMSSHSRHIKDSLQTEDIILDVTCAKGCCEEIKSLWCV